MIIGELAVILAANTHQFVKDFEASEQKVVSFGRKTLDVGKNIAVGLTLPLLAAGTAGVAMANDLIQGMANVGTLIPGQTARLEGLKDTVQDVQIATGKMTDELTTGMFQGRTGGMAATLALTDSQTQNTRVISWLWEVLQGRLAKPFKDQTEGINDVGFKMSRVRAEATVLSQEFEDA